jgi:hypothetical protein
LWVLGVGDALEQAIGGAQDRDRDFRAVDQRREAFVMAFAGFAEQDGLDWTAGAQGFFDQADTFDADAARFGGQSAAEGDTKFLEPAIVAAGDGASAGALRTRRSRRFCWRGHCWERSKFVAFTLFAGVAGTRGHCMVVRRVVASPK